jgi:hypothetical protein
MPLTIGAGNSAGAISFSCASASDTLNKVLELQLQRFENITLKNAAGGAIDLDELSAQYEASED